MNRPRQARLLYDHLLATEFETVDLRLGPCRPSFLPTHCGLRPFKEISDFDITASSALEHYIFDMEPKQALLGLMIV